MVGFSFHFYCLFKISQKLQILMLSDRQGGQQLPKTKFQLVQKVGSQGKYQQILVYIFTSVWGVASIMASGIVFFFVQKQFDCQSKGLLISSCQDAVCSLPREHWKNYLSTSTQYKKNIATEIGTENLCSDMVYNEIVISLTFLGNFFGIMVISTMADRLGRYKILLISWGCTLAGSILLLLSNNLWMAGLSFFLISLGSNSCLNLSFSYTAEFFQDIDRQRYSIIFQMAYPVVNTIITTLFLLIYNWVIIAVISLLIPSILVFIGILKYVKQTPAFLLPQGIDIILKQLNQIGYINSGQKNILKQDDIKNVLEHEDKVKELVTIEKNCNYQKSRQIKHLQEYKYTIGDLFRFPSLRMKVIPAAFIIFSLFSMYFGIIFLVDEFGLNLYLSSYTLCFSEIPALLVIFKYINCIPRRKVGVWCFSIIGLASIILFSTNKVQCSFCLALIFKIFLIAIFKIATTVQLTVMVVYINQLYPNKIKSCAIGFTLSMGALSTVLWPVVVGYCKRHNFNPNLLYVFLAYICLSFSLLLEETLGKPLDDDVEEIILFKQGII